MISVVLTTYKRPEKLKRAIQSVINQTFLGWELIVVDDCSKDTTEEVVKSFHNEKQTRFERQGLGAEYQKAVEDSKKTPHFFK